MTYFNDSNNPPLTGMVGLVASAHSHHEIKTTCPLNTRNRHNINTLHTRATPEASPLMSRNEAADYIGVRPQTLASWACNGRYGLPMVKIGRYAKYRKIDLDRFIEINLQGGEVLQ